jgi:hypothetical protein
MTGDTLHQPRRVMQDAPSKPEAANSDHPTRVSDMQVPCRDDHGTLASQSADSHEWDGDATCCSAHAHVINPHLGRSSCKYMHATNPSPAALAAALAAQPAHNSWDHSSAAQPSGATAYMPCTVLQPSPNRATITSSRSPTTPCVATVVHNHGARLHTTKPMLARLAVLHLRCAVPPTTRGLSRRVSPSSHATQGQRHNQMIARVGWRRLLAGCMPPHLMHPSQQHTGQPHQHQTSCCRLRQPGGSSVQINANSACMHDRPAIVLHA